jgi:hypothetical protein
MAFATNTRLASVSGQAQIGIQIGIRTDAPALPIRYTDLALQPACFGAWRASPLDAVMLI